MSLEGKTDAYVARGVNRPLLHTIADLMFGLNSNVMVTPEPFLEDDSFRRGSELLVKIRFTMRTSMAIDEMNAKGSAFEVALRTALNESEKEDGHVHQFFKTGATSLKKAGNFLRSAKSERVKSDEVWRKKHANKKIPERQKRKIAQTKERFVRAARYAKENPGLLHPAS